MNKEEKQAIETTKIIIEYAGDNFLCKEHREKLQTLLNLIEKQQRQLKIKDEYLRMIRDLGYDYDGCNTEKSLKELIDELVKYAKKAIKNDDTSTIYIGGDKEFNILFEERGKKDGIKKGRKSKN